MNHTESSQLPDDARSGPASPIVPPVPPAARTSLLKRRLLLVGFGIAILGLSALLVWKLVFPTRAHSLPPIRSLAVLPLVNASTDPRQEYFAEGETDGLTAELAQISGLRVISRHSAQTFKGTGKPAAQIAQELNVDGLIEGSVRREQNQIRTTIRLIDGRIGREVWIRSYERSVGDIQQLQADMAHAIVDQLGIELTSAEKARFNRIHRVDPEAVDLYLEGMQRLRNVGNRPAIELFRLATDKDPYYAAAHAALSDCYGRMGEAGVLSYSEAFAKQKAEAMRAIELDDSRPEPHLSLAFAALNESWDWATTKRELDRALALGPNSAEVHWDLALYYERIGQTKRAVEEGKIAAVLDPLSPSSYVTLAFHYYFDRQYDQALAQIQHAADAHATPDQILFPLGDINAERGDYERAIREFEQIGDLPHALGHMANAYARSGDSTAALKIIDRLKEHIEISGIGRYEVAIVYAGLHQNDKAFEWLEKAYQSRDKGITYILIDPCLDPVRNDPRLKDLARRVGFPSA